MPARPFNVAASLLLGDSAAGSWGFHPVATPVGVMLHVAGVILLGIVAAALISARRRRSSFIVPVIVTAVAGIVHLMLATRAANPGRTLGVAQLIVVYLLLTVGLVVGMRLARIGDRIE